MRPRRGGATESPRPLPEIQSPERRGEEVVKGKKIPTGSVGLCFWLGGKPRNAATGGVRTLPFTSRVSRQYFCAAFSPSFVCSESGRLACFDRLFLVKEKGDTDITALALWRGSGCAMNENCFWKCV